MAGPHLEAVGGCHLRHAEVEDLRDDVAVGIGSEKDVVRLQVAMHDAGAMSVRKGGQHRERNVDRLVQRKLAPLHQVVAERLAVQQLHHDRERGGLALRRLAVVPELHEIEDADDRAMAHARGGMGLAAEAFDGFVVVLVGHEDLDADLRTRRLVLRDPELRHPAEAGRTLETILLREERAFLENDRKLACVVDPIAQRVIGIGGGGHAALGWRRRRRRQATSFERRLDTTTP